MSDYSSKFNHYVMGLEVSLERLIELNFAVLELSKDNDGFDIAGNLESMLDSILSSVPHDFKLTLKSSTCEKMDDMCEEYAIEMKKSLNRGER